MTAKYAKPSYESLVASNQRLKEVVEGLCQTLLHTKGSFSLFDPRKDRSLVESFFVLTPPRSGAAKKVTQTRDPEDFEDYDLTRCEPMLPSPGLASRATADKAQVLGILCIRLNTQQTLELVEYVIRKQMEASSFIAVFLTEKTDVSVFVRNGLIFELLPTNQSGNGAEKTSWIKYRKMRIQLLIAKYGISKLVNASDLDSLLSIG